MSAATYSRPELAAFLALGTAQGWKISPHNDEEMIRFDIETSPRDEVTLTLYDHGPAYGGLDFSLSMYPEEELAAAAPEQIAATLARWLRDIAARIDAGAGEERDRKRRLPDMDLPSLPEPDIQEQIELRLAEMKGIFHQLREDEAAGFVRGQDWRWRAGDARQHLAREVAVLKGEWARRLVERGETLPGHMAEVGPTRHQMHVAGVAAMKALAAEHRRLKAERHEISERRNKSQARLFALTATAVLGKEASARLWEEARRRWPDEECWKDVQDLHPAEAPHAA